MDKNTKKIDNLDKKFLKKEMFVEALRKNLGNITKACKAININRQTYYNWKDADPQFQEKCDSVPEELLDMAEHALLTEIKSPESKGHTTAYIFYLKTKGKSRGYTEKQELELVKPFDRIELEDI